MQFFRKLFNAIFTRTQTTFTKLGWGVYQFNYQYHKIWEN